MSEPTPSSTVQHDDLEDSPDDELVRSGRDAALTRRALVRAARRRFATEGYRATTVREIAADAGVNVALINRYFTSKEGLFAACMIRTSDELDIRTPDRPSDLDGVIDRLVAHVVLAPDSDDPLQLLLLLRSSGDENADLIRRNTLEHFTRKLAAAAGWNADDPGTAPVLLRAQLAIATSLGVVMLRTSAAVQPVASADIDELTDALRDIFRALLTPRPTK
ncbi:TetR family transcriptional regulator [Amnibacterium flavum]|uniref:TetR/AcrR family transcriptional regulator n=1 Tax=Amnibacterium flavum TaxID=2173173 RepID=A0A2V1HP21_9MICO|nr:TetR/AcrR family transcriptional regulator [Amnibacterium flavum]PVZ94081.1 TetR/AcrR family transcriptional regulator [Amnibacterium flavum]